MSKINWSTAPVTATHYAAGRYWRFQNDGKGWERESAGSWLYLATLDTPYMFTDCEMRLSEWPTESRIEQTGQNEGDVMHYDEQREALEKVLTREAYLKQSAEQNRAPNSLGKYDRRIKGKYNTGTCTVDVYRVLSAFEITEPELQHCIKKLLAAGQRGAKDYQQDLKEAFVSLQMLIDRLAE